MIVRQLVIVLFLLLTYVESTSEANELIRWSLVQTPYTIVIWLLVACIAKIIFQKMTWLTHIVPDSALLISLGLLIGFILVQIQSSVNITLDAHVFFIYLLPPIIFEAGYFMPNKAFFENCDSIFLFSIFGTVWNTMSIGVCLIALSYFNLFSISCSNVELLIFSSVISASDPVAVIAIFEEININEFIFVNVLAEALFNDGISVVLYNMFTSILEQDLSVNLSLVLGKSFLFVVVTAGGLIIGVIFGFLTAFSTKFTNAVRVVAPIFIFVIPYMAYLTSEMLSCCSIMAIAVCGMVMKPYISGNISTSASNSVKYFTKVIAQSSETVIFMFLGLSTIAYSHYVDIPFIVCTISLTLICRTIGVTAQCAFLNRFRRKKFSMVDQVLLSYGGLRGAIAYGLAMSISESIKGKPMFITTTIALIFFNVFLQGITIRPLLKWLNVETRDNRRSTMTEAVYNKYMLYLMSGIEDIIGQRGHYSFIDKFERFDSKVLRPVLLRNEPKKNFNASVIVRTYAKMTFDDAVEMTQRNSKKIENRQLNLIKAEEARNNGSSYSPQVGFFATEESLQALYSMFCNLLEDKLKDMELRTNKLEELDDIKDDFIQQIQSTSGDNLVRNSGELPRISPAAVKVLNEILHNHRTT
ncbi:unnamed protein product [Auanema sp. JU1783]|nr:unnamed protein product [Auanema sp. JU1783]